MANCDSNKNVNKTFIIEPLELTAGTPTLTACTGVYTSKIIACSGDTSIEIYSGLTLNGYTLVNDTLSAVTIDASTIMSGGTNILEIVEASDTFVTGATYDTNNGILTISRNDGVDLTPSGFTSVINHTISSGSTKTIAQNDMYLIWDDFTINSGSTLDNNGRLVVVNGDFNNFGSYSGSGSLELITTNLEYILNHGNETNGNLIFYTNSPSGWVSGDTISDISAATGNVLVTKEWVELATSVDNNDFTTGATLVDETIVFDRKDALSAYTVDISSVNSGDTFVTGGTLVNKELVLDRNDSLSAVTVDLSGLTNNTGAGLTYNPTTGKIDLGGVLDFNDPGNSANNMFFAPAATGANNVVWGLGANYTPVPTNYIARFDTFTNQGKHEIHGHFQHPGVNIGLYMSNTPSVSFRQYKDVTQILGGSGFPGPTSGMTYQEFDSPTEHQREIWESYSSTTRSYSKQTFDKFKWNVYNNVGGDNALSKTYINIESERVIMGAVNSGGTKFGIFQFAPTHIQFLDGDFKGVGTFPTSTYLGDLAKSNLIIENDSADSTFKDATSNKRGIKYIGFGETNTETGVGANYSTLVGTSLVPKKWVVDYITSPSGNTFVTGTTFTNNQLNIALNNGTSVGTTIDNLSGLTVDGNVLVNGDVNIIGTATTINSEQVLIKDNIITLNSNVTGSTSPVLNAGFEVLRGSADTKSILWLENTDLWSIDDDLSVSGYVSGTTYYGDGSNLTGIDDTFVTGGTYSGSTIILNRNDGNSVNVTGITSDSIYTADGTIGTGRIATLTDTLTFKGADDLVTSSNIKIQNDSGIDLWDFRNDGDVYFGQNTKFQGGAYGFIFNRTTGLDTVAIQSNGSNIATFGIYTELFGGAINIGGTGGTNALDNGLKISGDRVRYYTTQDGASQTHDIYRNKFAIFKSGFSSPLNSYLSVGGNAPIGTEQISLQGDTLISKKLELSTTDNGMLMPRLTTAQMNAISSPDTHLLIFNTDLNALYRYNSSAWVAMTAGYGIVSTVDSSGNPTFYATVKAAYDAGAGNVKLHTDYEETTSNPINIVNNRNVDLNGFTYTYNVADGTSIFEDTTQNNSIRVTNGRLIRKNGTGSDYVINCNLTQTRMDILNVYAENENGLCLNLRTTLNGSGSEFVSNNTSGNGFFFNTGSIVSFGKYINENNGGTQFNGAEIKFAEFVCLGSGMNYMGGNIFNSRFISNSGRAMLTGSATKIYDCYLESSSSNALDMRNNSEIYNSTIISDGTVCVNTVGSTATKMIGCTVKGSNSVYSVNSLSLVEDCIIVNSGTGKGIEVNATTQIINNIITLEAGTADAIDLNTYVNSLVSGNKIFVNDPSATGIVSANVNVYIVDNKIKGTTLGVDLGSGVNIWTATTDAHGNSVQL